MPQVIVYTGTSGTGPRGTGDGDPEKAVTGGARSRLLAERDGKWITDDSNGVNASDPKEAKEIPDLSFRRGCCLTPLNYGAEDHDRQPRS